ncbi:MAG: site-specific integrase [Chloroflexi bacterium]|nr:site-specific integrase [Chloroflexota bacterium]
MARRRANGEGRIDHEADGRYAARIRIDGRLHATHARTQREAAAWLSALRSRSRAGVDVTDRSTLAEFLVHWLETARPGLRHNTWVLYDQVIRDHVLPFIGAVRLDALRPDHIQRLYADQQAAGASAWTVRKIHVCLHRALGQAAVWGLAVRNVADLVEVPARPRGAVVALQPDEVQRLLVAAQGERIESLLYLAVVTGMRLGELLGLRWLDVDWDRGAVSVCRQLCRLNRGGGLSFAPVKTQSGNRVVRLGADGLAALRDQRRRLDDARLLAGEQWVEGDLIFPSSLGTPLEPRRAYTEFQRVLARAGVRAVRFHDLRHTSASLALRGGVPAKIVSERLGHSSVGITLDLYSHVADELQAGAAQVLEEQVRPLRAQLPAG